MSSPNDLEEKEIKYLIVTGGTLSGLGKGTAISSLGVLLKSHGLNVTSMKIDPYLNVDAGTMSPFEHGEVYYILRIKGICAGRWRGGGFGFG